MAGTFVIAGGSKGIGQELVRFLHPHSDQILVYSRTPGEFLGDDRIVYQGCDFTDDALELSQLPDEIQGAAYCPGSINLRSFRSLKPDDFREDFELNLMGAVRFLQACLPGLKKGARENPSSVVLFSTVAVGQGMPMHASVACAKGAVEGLSRTLAAEWAPQIRVNCIAPALTETPLASRFFSTEEKKSAMAARYPLARTGVAQDPASLAMFLLQPENSWITGQVFGVDGGMSTVHT